MIVHIVAGGPAHYIPDLTQYHNDKNIFWLSVDRGTKYLLDAGIKPGMAIGDFDSISKQDFELFQKAGIPIKKFNAEKDETDMELALNFAYANLPEKIRIFGATGGRLDHFLANINLLYQWVEKNKEVNVEFIDRQNIATVKIQEHTKWKK